MQKAYVKPLETFMLFCLILVVDIISKFKIYLVCWCDKECSLFWKKVKTRGIFFYSVNPSIKNRILLVDITTWTISQMAYRLRLIDPARNVGQRRQ